MNIFRLPNNYIIKDMFEFVPLDKTLKIIIYSKRLHELLEYDNDTIFLLLRWMKIIKPTYKNIKKYIKYNEHNVIKLSKYLSIEQNLFFAAINSTNSKILINLKDKNWKLLIKKLININLEISPNLIDYINSMSENERKEILEYLKKYKKHIKEIYFNSFIQKNEINFEIRNKIIYILNYIFKPSNKKETNYNYLDKISFGKNSIMSIFDINNILIEFANILFYNNKGNIIQELYINSKTIKNEIININSFITSKIPILQHIQLDKFFFLNNNNSSQLSNLFSNLKYLNKIDLSNCVCDNNNLDEILKNKMELKELKIKILYGEKMINWKFLNKFEKFLENLEIEIEFQGKNYGILKKLKIIGDYLNNYDLNLLNNEKITNFNFSFYIINPEKILNYVVEPSLNTTFLYFNELKEISLTYNNFNNEFMKSDKYNGIDLLFEKNKERAYKLAIFEFPKKLLVLKLSNFIDRNFLKFYLIPLLNKNKEKLSQIEEIRLSGCFLEVSQFEEFLSILPLISHLYILSINKILFYDKFKMKNLINYIPTIFKNAPNLIELDLSNNKYKNNSLNENIVKIKEKIPSNLISFKIFNSLIPISCFILKNMKNDFGQILNYENVSIINNGKYY